MLTTLGLYRRPGDLIKVEIEHIAEIVNIYIKLDSLHL
jgi:hypothetical protein